MPANQQQSTILRIVDDPNQELSTVQHQVSEYLNTTKDRELIPSLVSVYLQSKSVRVLNLLVSLRDPHHKAVIDRCTEYVRDPCQRTNTLKMLLCLIQKDPPWLHDVYHKVLREAVSILKENDASNSFICLVILSSLLPLIPGVFDKRNLESMFHAFSHAAAFCADSKSSIAELNLAHLCSGLYAFYQVLYSMYPCNFLAYLRQTYGNSDNKKQNLKVFNETIWPMMKRTFMHPFLVLYNSESETNKDRWKGIQKHDIIVDCSKYVLESRDYPQELVKPKMAVSKPCSIPKRKDFIRNAPSSDGVLGKKSNVLDVMTHHASDLSSSLGSVDIAEEANPEEPEATSVPGSIPMRPRRQRRSSANLPPIPAEGADEGDNDEVKMEEDGEENSATEGKSVFCSTTQRLTEEPTNSISEHAEMQEDPSAHSEMESLIQRHKYLSQCQPASTTSSPSQGQLGPGKLTRSMSCPANNIITLEPVDNMSLSDTGSSSNEDLSSKCMSLSLWPSSPEPKKGEYLAELSPAELLDKQLKYCSERVIKEIEQQQPNANNNNNPGELIKELRIMKTHATLLYVELLYERYRKEIHIERNRRLLEKAKRIIQLEEQNSAMREEIKECREEIGAKTSKIRELQQLLDQKDAEMCAQVKQLMGKMNELQENNKIIMLENSQLACTNHEQRDTLGNNDKEINTLGSELHEARLHLENVKMKAEEQLAYKEKCVKLEQELLTLQEMYSRLQEMAGTGVHDCATVFNKDELAKELRQCKSRLEHRRQDLEAAQERQKLHINRIEEDEKQIKDLRSHLRQVEANTVEQLRAKDDRINALRKSTERLQVCVLQLHGKLDCAQAFSDESARNGMQSSTETGEHRSQ